MSQQRVADEMNARYGYDWRQTTIAKIEAADRPLRLREAIQIADMFGVNLLALVDSARGLSPESVQDNIANQRDRLSTAQTHLAAARKLLAAHGEEYERAEAEVKKWERVEASARLTLQVLGADTEAAQ